MQTKSRQIKFQYMHPFRYIILLSAGQLMLLLFAVPALRAGTDYTGETVFLHTDKPYAVPGERIWFKAYIYSDELAAGKTENKLLNVTLVNIDNEIVFSGKYRITGNYADGCLDIPADLIPGVYCLHYYTNYMKYRGERTKSKILPVFDLYADYFSVSDSAGRPLNGKGAVYGTPEDILSVEIITDKEEYLPGEEAFIRLRTTGPDGQPQSADLSVAVVDEQQFDAGVPWSDNIITDKFLTGHLRGRLTEPRGFVNPGWMSDSDTMDLFAFMSASFEKEVSAAKKSGYLHESAMKSIMSLCGRVVFPVTGLPVSYQLILLSTDSGKPALQSLFTDSDGYFCFEDLNEFTGEAIIRIQLIREIERAELLVLDKASVVYANTFHPTEFSAVLQEYKIDATPSDPVKKILLQDGSEIIFSLTSKPEIRLFLYPEDISCCNFNYEISDLITSRAANYINSYRIRELAGMLYEKEKTAPVSSDNILPPLYTRPDFSYNLDDYIAFENVGQLFNDLIGGVSVGGQGTEQYFVTRAGGSMFDGKPLILINGIPTSDASLLLGMDPGIIRQIDILTSPETLVNLPAVCRNGLIVVYLRYNDFRFPESGGRKTFNFQGLSKPCMPDKIVDFEQHRYNRKPDLRPVLLWEPYVSTDVNGEATFSFRNSDDITNYRIIVQGLSHQGVPGYATTVYKVKVNEK